MKDLAFSALLKKYNIPGPRYTSYPTVPYWETSPTSDQWIQAIGQALQTSKLGSALYVHIPFCKSLCTYCGCNTRITRNNGVSKPYIETILKELELYRERLGVSRIPMAELHLGGGTPTFLTPDELELLLNGIFTRVELGQAQTTQETEFGIEVDPRVTSKAHLEVLANFGFKRLSLGVQDFDPKVQDIVHRTQSEEQVRVVTEEARKLGFNSVNFDLIYGLPLQTETSVLDTIKAVGRLKPDRIAFYAYAHVPWIKPSQRRFTEADLPEGEAKRRLYELGREELEAAGYREIGMDHFALTTDSLWKASETHSLHRNFMGYISRQVAPLLGIGVSAIGDAWTAFAQNEKLLETYQERVHRGEIPIHRGHVLTPEDLILRRHILNLMTQFKTEWSSPDLQTDFLNGISDRLSEAVRDGLIALEKQSCVVLDRGRPFLRNLCMAFDARLARKQPTQRIFSQTI